MSFLLDYVIPSGDPPPFPIGRNIWGSGYAVLLYLGMHQ